MDVAIFTNHNDYYQEPFVTAIMAILMLRMVVLTSFISYQYIKTSHIHAYASPILP
jgi:hypothetical protein